MDPGSLHSALSRLDPASRALLDLSLRRGVDDDSIAELLGTDAATVADDRDRTIAGVAAAVGGHRPEDPSTVREAIASLSAESWAEASPEAAHRSPAPAAAAVEPSHESSAREPVERAPRSEPEPRATGRADAGGPAAARPAPRPPSGGASPLRSGRDPAKRRSLVGPLAVGAVLLIALAVLLGMLLSSGEDDGSTGTGGGSQTVGEGEETGAEGPAPGGGENGGQTEPRDGGGSGGQASPGGRDGRGGGEANAPAGGSGGAALEPLPGKLDTGRGTARLEGEGEEAAVSLTVTGLPAPDGEYEVWLYNSLSDARSLGRFAGRQIELFQPLPVDPADYRFLDVSLEPPDGNENHSGQSVLRAPLEELRQQP